MTGQEFKDLHATGERGFQNVSLNWADLSEANLSGASLWKCNLWGAIIDPGALSAKQIADGCFDDYILEKQGWVRKADCAELMEDVNEMLT